jgi:hypothetical protein
MQKGALEYVSLLIYVHLSMVNGTEQHSILVLYFWFSIHMKIEQRMLHTV